jgi:hypothetical protein
VHFELLSQFGKRATAGSAIFASVRRVLFVVGIMPASDYETNGNF